MPSSRRLAASSRGLAASSIVETVLSFRSTTLIHRLRHLDSHTWIFCWIALASSPFLPARRITSVCAPVPGDEIGALRNEIRPEPGNLVTAWAARRGPASMKVIHRPASSSPVKWIPLSFIMAATRGPLR